MVEVSYERLATIFKALSEHVFMPRVSLLNALENS